MTPEKAQQLLDDVARLEKGNMEVFVTLTSYPKSWEREKVNSYLVQTFSDAVVDIKDGKYNHVIPVAKKRKRNVAISN